MSSLWEALLPRVLPSVVSLALSFFSFGRSMMILGIEANKNRCPDCWRHEFTSFPCLSPGATALTICYAAISLSMTFVVSGLLYREVLVWYTFAGGFLFAGTMGCAISYKKEIFRLEDHLRIYPSLADNMGFAANLFFFFISAIVAYYSIPMST